MRLVVVSELVDRIPAIALLVGVLGVGGAQLVRGAANDARPPAIADEPYAPSTESARIVSLGYNELAADLLAVRLVGYFGGQDSTGNGVISLVEAIVTLDPTLRWVYEWGARATTIAKHSVDTSDLLRATAVLEQGAKRFPSDWKIPYLAGQIYTQDLQTDDVAQRRAWDERGTLLVEQAIRRPHAPATVAVWASAMRSRFGQHQRAVDELKEMFLVTDDEGARQRILEKLAELNQVDASEIAAEGLLERHAFEQRWAMERPALPATMYILLGPGGIQPFDMTDLATGGRDLAGAIPVERLPPLD